MVILNTNDDVYWLIKDGRFWHSSSSTSNIHIGQIRSHTDADPTLTPHWVNVFLTAEKRRCPSIKPILGQCLVFAGVV